MNLGPVAKAFNGTVTAILLSLIGALADGGVSNAEWVSVAITAVVTGVTVFYAANYKVAYAKAIAGSLSAGLGTLGTVLSGGFADVTPAQWLMVVVALLGNAAVVSQTPNALRSEYTKAA